MDTIINVETPSIEITFTDVGAQGLKGAQGFGLNYQWSDTNLGVKRGDEDVFVYQNLKGAKGDSLDFGDLTEQQKQELRGDVGDTSTNYTNVFLNSLLS